MFRIIIEMIRLLQLEIVQDYWNSNNHPANCCTTFKNDHCMPSAEFGGGSGCPHYLQCRREKEFYELLGLAQKELKQCRRHPNLSARLFY